MFQQMQTVLAVPQPTLTEQISTLPRLLEALVLGASIGAERQWRHRSAGLRTNTLVCLGAAAFVNMGMAPGVTQVTAYVVSGVGFLGAGAIMKDGASVRGLNTAATLWCSAAVGACAGSGQLLNALLVAVLMLSVNSLLRPLGRYIDRRSLAKVEAHTMYRIRVVCKTELLISAEFLLTRAIAKRALALHELRSEAVENTDTTLLQAVVEASTKDDLSMTMLLEEIREDNAVESADSLLAEHETE